MASQASVSRGLLPWELPPLDMGLLAANDGAKGISVHKVTPSLVKKFMPHWTEYRDPGCKAGGMILSSVIFLFL